MPYIQTFTGRKFNPLDPQPEDICIEDIAHALSLLCRFCGHCKEFYSVAQHSVLVSNSCKENKLWGLLHDASEAVIYDICTPLKGALSNYREIERNVMRVICDKWELPVEQPLEVYQWDHVLLLTEDRDLMAIPIGLEYFGLEPLKDKIIPWNPKFAENEFLNTYYGLIIGKQGKKE